VVLLAGPGESTDIVANYLAARVPDLRVIVEDPPSRVRIARRRARRVGRVAAVGQIVFVGALVPLLRRQGAGRHAAILDTSPVDPTPRAPDHRVPSINDEGVVDLVASLAPDVLVVNGTRIIAPPLLASLTCPIINMHAGLTPRYRGVHGGYWALAEGRPEWVGTTVHLVDRGIDTGGVLAQSVFDVTDRDSFATYPLLHVVAGLPLLGDQVDRALAGAPLEPVPAAVPGGGGLRYHPTAWGYLWRRWTRGVR